MDTPICDFIKKYRESDALRLHMPGHKGVPYTGCEADDITEIDGADSLYEAEGIIKQSELNASSLFGCDTFYSAEGSSLCIRAMLFLAMQYASAEGRRSVIAAGRNAHKCFLNTAALLDFDIMWLYGKGSYLSCIIEPDSLDKALALADDKPVAVYITSPDYLGNIADIASLSRVCRKHGALLLVDNAHGAYLKFFDNSLHPMDLGADMCCDSAHKTLPVLTGGAYLHVAAHCPNYMKSRAKSALALFGSTSPSYLIMQSLDMANRYIADGYRQRLESFVIKSDEMKKRLRASGFALIGNEPLKLTFATKFVGYTGSEFANEIYKHNIVCEFADPDFAVYMLTPEIGEEGLVRLEEVLCALQKKAPLISSAPCIGVPEKKMTPREAVFSHQEELDIAQCCGRVLASPGVSCPPAVPIVVCGEIIDENAVRCFEYYGIKKCTVVCE